MIGVCSNYVHKILTRLHTCSPHSQFCTQNGTNRRATGAVIAHHIVLYGHISQNGCFSHKGSSNGRGCITLITVKLENRTLKREGSKEMSRKAKQQVSYATTRPPHEAVGGEGLRASPCSWGESHEPGRR